MHDTSVNYNSCESRKIAALIRKHQHYTHVTISQPNDMLFSTATATMHMNVPLERINELTMKARSAAVLKNKPVTSMQGDALAQCDPPPR